ncbi:MAG: hypothetical protein CL623_09195 [Arcobacter sp.]|nr:hypothetical protein [Arcobacter sp.]|tara:strand:- start:11218 stop:11424 length:207 start_codon:yes stop_codon:yes gene_type:complete
MDKINSQVQYLSKTIDDFRNFFRGDTSDIKDAFCKLEELTKDSLKDNYIKYYNKSVDTKLLLNENLFI